MSILKYDLYTKEPTKKLFVLYVKWIKMRIFFIVTLFVITKAWEELKCSIQMIEIMIDPHGEHYT